MFEELALSLHQRMEQILKTYGHQRLLSRCAAPRAFNDDGSSTTTENRNLIHIAYLASRSSLDITR